ncbi:MAG: metallophosphoesterase family protein [Firmicutes bacterium]|nr:metallophosphoesterase family protein [Bacillota bacterium]
MDQIAIISDVHGNLTALDTVLDDIHKRKISHIYSLGDIIAKGTHAEECVRLIRQHCEVSIQGNCDGVFSSEMDLSGMDQLTVSRILWNQNKLSKESKEYLKNLPFSYEFYMSGRLVRIFHAHPEKYDNYIGAIDSFDHLYSMFLPSNQTPSADRADIAIYGHIHLPFVQKLYNRIILNPGSVGNSMDCVRDAARDGDVRATAVANYLILKGTLNSRDWQEPLSYEIINLPYDIERELSLNEDNIEQEAYIKELRYGWYRNMAKVERMARENGLIR